MQEQGRGVHLHRSRQEPAEEVHVPAKGGQLRAPAHTAPEPRWGRRETRKPACSSRGSGREPILTARSEEGVRTPGLVPGPAGHGRAHSPPGTSGPSTLTWPVAWKHNQGCFLSASPHTRRLLLCTPSAGGIASAHGTHSQAGLGHGAVTVSPRRPGTQETCRPMSTLSIPNHTSEGMKATRLHSRPIPPPPPAHTRKPSGRLESTPAAHREPSDATSHCESRPCHKGHEPP